MPLYKYSELTEEQKKLVSVMYADLSDVEDYLYRWDEDKYSGRQPASTVNVQDQSIREDDNVEVKGEPEVKEVKEEKSKIKSVRSRKK